MDNKDSLYQAMLTRDYRFDGKFFIGVKTTGIYCRPICPAKPKFENIEFFKTALEAENKGYRPCLRCHPESAPFSPKWYGKSSIVQRALKMLTLQLEFPKNEEEFAKQFGITSRHFRRLFKEEVGQTAKQISDSNRLNFAQKLISETSLSITIIAMISGFSSLRRFNDAFLKRFHRAPSITRKKMQNMSEGSLKISLAYRPPFCWENLIAFCNFHQVIGIDRVEEDSYERIFKIDEVVGLFRVTPAPNKDPKLIVEIFADNPKVIFTIAQRVRQMFDLDSDPLLIANNFREAHPFMDELWEKYPGLRMMQGWDPFETVICTILGQFVSMKAARNFISYLIKHYGEQVINPVTKEKSFIFPTPEILATAGLEEVKTTKARKETIREVARLVANKEIDLITPQNADVLKNKLLKIPGIGPWSAEYISLRALGNTDAFPKTDLILKRALAQHPDLNTDRLRPWRSYAAIYLWKHYHGKLTK